MKDFTTGSIPKLMISFLGPLLMSNLLGAVYVLIDAIWAGRLLGPSGVAIVATGMPVIFLLSSFMAGLVIGASILAGQAFGAKNRQLLSAIISNSAIGMVTVSLVISVIGVVSTRLILAAISTPLPLRSDAQTFLSLIIGSMTLSALVQWFSAIMNATGDSHTPLKILLVSLVLNAVLAPVFITGAHLFPPLGIAGSALATICAQLVAAIICILVWRNHHLSELAPFRFQIHKKTLRAILSIGFPMSLQMIIVSSSFLFILALANRFGIAVAAAFGIGSRVDQFAFMSIFAVTAAIAAMTAQNIGAERMDRIPEITRWGVIISLCLALVYTLAVTVAPDHITRLFTADQDVIRVTRGYFHIAGFSYIALALLFAYQGVMRGAGDTFTSFIIVAISMILLRVPLCFILSHYTRLQETGLWLGGAISSCTGAAAFYWYYTGGKWKTRGMRVHHRSPAASAALAAPETTLVEPACVPPVAE